MLLSLVKLTNVMQMIYFFQPIVPVQLVEMGMPASEVGIFFLVYLISYGVNAVMTCCFANCMSTCLIQHFTILISLVGLLMIGPTQLFESYLSEKISFILIGAAVIGACCGAFTSVQIPDMVSIANEKLN
jgi:hypothetical protein